MTTPRSTLLVHDTPKDATRHLPAPVVIATDGAGSPVRAAMVERFAVPCREEPLGHAYKELTIPPGDQRRSSGSREGRAAHLAAGAGTC